VNAQKPYASIVGGEKLLNSSTRAGESPVHPNVHCVNIGVFAEMDLF